MRRSLIVLALLAMSLALLPFVASRGLVLTVTEASAVLAIAVAWNLLASFGGVVLVGLPLFIGIGAYTLFVAANAAGLPAHIMIPLSGIVSGAAAVALAPLIFRLGGAQLAIGSWVMAEIGRIVVLQSDALGAGGGLNLEVVRLIPRALRLNVNYAAAVAVALVALLAVVMLMRSRWGLALRAMKDAEAAASSVGIEVQRVRWLVLALCAAITGMAAGVFYIGALQVTPGSAFGINWMAIVIFIVVLGGIGSLEGPILGTVAYFAMREAFADQGELYFILLGTLAIATVIFAPRGLWGLVHDRLGFDLLPVDRVPPGMNCETIVRNVSGGSESRFLAGASGSVSRPAAVTPSGVSPANGLATEYAEPRPDSGLLYWIRRIHNQMTKGAPR